MSTINYYFNYLISEFEGYPFIIRMSVIFVMFLSVICLCALLRIFYISYKNKKSNKTILKIKREYESNLYAILFSNENITEEKLKEKYQLKIPQKKREKKYLTEYILKIRNEAVREKRKNMFNKNNFLLILRYTELYDYWEKELSSGNKNRIIKSLRILDEIGEGVSGAAIARSVYHREDYLRKYARNAFTRFDIHESYKFLEEDFDKHINKFDEVRLHNTLKELLKERPLPPLTRWIQNAKNDQYKCFLIKEIGYFKQIECAPYILELYNNTKNISIKAKCAETLGELKYAEALPFFRKEFKYVPQLIQYSIITGVGFLQSKEALKFLKEAYEITHYKETKIHIVNTINLYGSEGKEMLWALSQNSNSEFEIKMFGKIIGNSSEHKKVAVPNV